MAKTTIYFKVMAEGGFEGSWDSHSGPHPPFFLFFLGYAMILLYTNAVAI